MSTLKQIIFASMLVLALLSTAAAQEGPGASAQSSSFTITAAATGERVRITAPASIAQLHVEVYSATGEKLFDQEIRGGNVFDWHLQNGQGQRLVPGSYVCVVTAKSVSGRISQKIGTVSVEEKSVKVQRGNSQKLSMPQAQAIGPVEEDSSWTISGSDEPQTPTIVAHDGTDGQMIRGRGALTFRIGNFFTGNDREQMRLTEDGRLGIGTAEPKSTLDVAGTIRAQRFLVVKPKPVGTGGSAQDSLTSNATDPVDYLVTGTGTTNRVTKWIDGAAGTLGDSAITETGGRVGIGTTTPGSKLVVSSNAATLPAASGIARFAEADGVQTSVFADSFGTNPVFNVRRANGTAVAPTAVQASQVLGAFGASGYGASAYMGTRARVAFLASENWTNTANGTYITFNTTANGVATPGGTEGMRIDNAGNVLIGATSGTDKLHVEAAAGQIAVYALTGTNGTAVFGGTTSGVGVQGSSSSGIGVSGGSSSSSGVFGISNTGPGVTAFSSSGNLVEGSNGAPKFHITNAGTYVAGSDFAEALPAIGDRAGYEPGDVLVVSTKAPGRVEKASRAYDQRVAGIYSTRPGMLGADKNGTSRVEKDDLPVAIVGIVPTKVSAMNGRIRVGDLLTTSSTPGYAMRCTNRVKCVGAIVGKALEPLAGEKGVIKILVMLR